MTLVLALKQAQGGALQEHALEGPANERQALGGQARLPPAEPEAVPRVVACCIVGSSSIRFARQAQIGLRLGPALLESQRPSALGTQGSTGLALDGHFQICFRAVGFFKPLFEGELIVPAGGR